MSEGAGEEFPFAANRRLIVECQVYAREPMRGQSSGSVRFEFCCEGEWFPANRDRRHCCMFLTADINLQLQLFLGIYTGLSPVFTQ
jgi:hypothetical protein